MSALVMAIDGGGSKSRVAFADQSGGIEHLPVGSGINAVDNPAWEANLSAVLVGSEARIARTVSAVLGLPGYSEIPAIDVIYSNTAERIVEVDHTILNDVYMAYDGAFVGQPGVLALAGTGSMVVGRDAEGEPCRAGGWGEGFGDEGSGYWIGAEALRRASYAVDGIEPAPEFLTAFLKLIDGTRQTPAASINSWFNGLAHRRSEVAALAQAIDAWAEDGDPTAQLILAAAAGHVFRQVKAIEARVRVDGAAAPDWSYAGSVFESALFTRQLTHLMGREPRPPRLPPIGGGLWGAARRAGWPADDAWIDAIAQGLANESDASTT
ncbi:MAG: ATPase [Hyphomicrobiales bacterium]|nr:ATPase [Hyphomicrobiales bacterium]